MLIIYLFKKNAYFLIYSYFRDHPKKYARNFVPWNTRKFKQSGKRVLQKAKLGVHMRAFDIS
jgi:hypothetical protein